MTILRRIGSGFLFVLAILGALAALAGVFGVWWARAWADQAVLNAVTAVNGFVSLAGESIDSFDQRLAEAEQTVQTVQTGIAGLGDGELTPAEEALQRTIVEDLQPRLERLRDGAVQLNTAVSSINRNIEQLNRVPLVNMPAVGAGLEEFQNDVAATAVRARELAEAAKNLDGSRILAATENLSNSLAQARAAIVRAETFATNTQAALEELRVALSFWMTVAAWVLTPVLLLFVAGQISLAFHAWGWMRAQRQGKPQVVRV